MSKKSKKSDKAEGILLLIILLVIAILFLVVIITPVVLLVGFLTHLFKFLPYRKKINGTFSDFWLNEKQKEEFRYLSSSIYDANKLIEESNKIADSQGISRNLDRTISAKSNKGRELRSTIEKNEAIISELFEKHDVLRNLPFNSWKKFSLTFTRMNSFAIGLLVYIISALILITIYYENFKVGLKSFLAFPKTMFSGDVSLSDDWIVMSIVILLSVFSYLIGRLIFKYRSMKKSPIPPEVNIENVDIY